MYIAIPTTVRTDHALARARRCVTSDCRHLIQIAASPRFATHASLEGEAKFHRPEPRTTVMGTVCLRPVEADET